MDSLEYTWSEKIEQATRHCGRVLLSISTRAVRMRLSSLPLTAEDLQPEWSGDGRYSGLE